MQKDLQLAAVALGRLILYRVYSVDPIQNIEGALRYAPHSAGQILDEHGVRKVSSRDFIERFGSAYVNELREFVHCIRERRKPAVDVTDGVEATRIALAATRSFQEKKLITF